jgi:hypothetical protein
MVATQIDEVEGLGMVDVAYNFRLNLDALLTRDEGASALKALLGDQEFQIAAKAVIASRSFGARLDRLAKILMQAGVRTVDRQMLTTRMFGAALLYGGAEFFSAKKTTVGELRDPLAQLIEILNRDENRTELLVALGAPVHTPTESGRTAHNAATRMAAERLEVLVAELQRLAQGLPEAPKAERGRPAKRDLEAVIDLLAQDYEHMTRRAFTQSWYTDEKGGRVPNSLGAQFVYEIAGFIDEKCLQDVPGATERVVAERRRTSGKSPNPT